MEVEHLEEEWNHFWEKSRIQIFQGKKYGK